MYELLYRYIRRKTDINEKDFAQICHYFRLRNAKRKELILREGEVCSYNIFVNKGCLKFYSINNQGNEFIRYFAFESKFGTALSSFINRQPSFEYIQAVENSELLTISHKDFFYLVENVPQMNFIYRDILEMAYITSQQRIYGLQGSKALDQLKWFMEYQPKILSRLSNKVVASYLGVSAATLSRLKSEL